MLPTLPNFPFHIRVLLLAILFSSIALSTFLFTRTPTKHPQDLPSEIVGNDVPPSDLTDYLTQLLDSEATSVRSSCNFGVTLLKSTWPSTNAESEHKLIAQNLKVTVPQKQVHDLLDSAYIEQIDYWLSENSQEDCTSQQLFYESHRAPWTSKQLPVLSESWITEQEESLNRLHKIHTCSEFYLPEPQLLTAERLPFRSPGNFSSKQIWTAALALAMRTMYYVGNNQSELAWQDAKSCLALACLPNCHNHEDIRCRIKVRILALHCCVAIVTESDCDATVLSNMLKYISDLPDASLLLTDALTYQRLSCLSLADRLSSQGFKAETDFEWGVVEYLNDKQLSALGYREQAVESEIQRWCDDIERIIARNGQSVAQSSKNALDIAHRIPKPYSEPLDRKELREMSADERGKAVGSVLVGFSDATDLALAAPVLHGMAVNQQLVVITIELQRYYNKHLHYPDSLEALPDSRQLTQDPFSDNLLNYRPIDDGYLLYSVYFNQTDDGGDGGDPTIGQIVDGEWVIGQSGIEIGEDLVVRVPIAPFQTCSRNRGEPSN